jgi:hypothetical protein
MGFVWIGIGSVFSTHEYVTSPHGSTLSATFLDHLITSPSGYLFFLLTLQRKCLKKHDRPRFQVTSFQYEKQAVSVAEEVSLKNDERSSSVVEYNDEYSKWSTEHRIFSGQVHVLKLSLRGGNEHMPVWCLNCLCTVLVGKVDGNHDTFCHNI